MKRLKHLDALIEYATVDCSGDDEQRISMPIAVEEGLSVPFKTQVFDITVDVMAVELNDAGELVAICKGNGKRQRIPLVDLPLPPPPPSGAEWITAYRQRAKWFLLTTRYRPDQQW